MAKETKKTPVPEKEEVKESPAIPEKSVDKISTVKIDPKDLIQLQKDGRLMGYDPTTGIGQVREKGLATIWPDSK